MTALSGKRRLVVREVGSETIVYDPRTHRAHCLGPAAAAVWRECDGHSSTSEIAGRMRVAGGEPIHEAAIAVALRRLERAGLVDGQASRTAGSPERHSPGHVAGRRAALRRVAALAGLAVASLVVPTPEAAAATCTRTPLQTCQQSAECCPSNFGTAYCCANVGGSSRCVPRGIPPFPCLP